MSHLLRGLNYDHSVYARLSQNQAPVRIHPLLKYAPPSLATFAHSDFVPSIPQFVHTPFVDYLLSNYVDALDRRDVHDAAAAPSRCRDYLGLPRFLVITATDPSGLFGVTKSGNVVVRVADAQWVATSVPLSSVLNRIGTEEGVLGPSLILDPNVSPVPSGPGFHVLFNST